MGEIVEIETFVHKFILVNIDFTFLRNKFRKNSPVFSQDIVHITHVVSHFTVEAVVVVVAAHIRTEFLVHSPADRFSAIEAKLFHTMSDLKN